jgi:hypothetical protein
MQNAAWIKLWRRLPPEQHDNLMVMTAVGTEIAIQNILRIEEDFVVIRGRSQGSSDLGRVFFIPYSQINYAGFQKALKEEEFDALFGEATGAGTTPESAAPPPEPAAPAATSRLSSLTSGTNSDRARSLNRPPLPLKPELLEKLRARVQSHQGTTPRPSPEE